MQNLLAAWQLSEADVAAEFSGFVSSQWCAGWVCSCGRWLPQVAQDTGMSWVQTDIVFSFSLNSGKAAREEAGEGCGHATQAPEVRGWKEGHLLKATSETCRGLSITPRVGPVSILEQK